MRPSCVCFRNRTANIGELLPFGGCAALRCSEARSIAALGATRHLGGQRSVLVRCAASWRLGNVQCCVGAWGSAVLRRLGLRCILVLERGARSVATFGRLLGARGCSAAELGARCRCTEKGGSRSCPLCETPPRNPRMKPLREPLRETSRAADTRARLALVDRHVLAGLAHR